MKCDTLDTPDLHFPAGYHHSRCERGEGGAYVTKIKLNYLPQTRARAPKDALATEAIADKRLA